MKARIFLIAALAVLATVLLLVLLLPTPDPALPGSLPVADAPERLVTVDIDQTTPNLPADAIDHENRRLAQELVDNYGDSISDPAVQVSLLRLREALLRKDPQNGLARFDTILQLAFPDLATEIAESVSKMATYRDWLYEVQPELVALDQLQQDAMLWTRRRELFGDAAERIWTAEREQAAQQQRQIQTTIARLDKAYDTSLEEKVYQLETALEDTYGDLQSHAPIGPAQTAQVYFDLDSVQSVLHEMPNEERQDKIRELRMSMGFTEAEARKLGESDAKRNERWDKGLSYMSRRQDLEARLEGEQLATALADLREEAFGAEAPTIAKEEAIGFFRYKRPRLYGRN
ncbi:hypothetical protein [Allohahella marinimesophila]|uniref:Lipase helper protein n=1 Tax=Allohahella marinimesophila TaxID=1054972 RepID=A0ABP7P6J4_9GAMM